MASGDNNRASYPRLFITDEEITKRIYKLAHAWEVEPSVVVERLCRYGLHNHEEVLAAVEEIN
jgi:hypothetical protein